MSSSVSISEGPAALALASCSALRSANVFSVKVLASGTRRLCRSISVWVKHFLPVSSHTQNFSSSDT